MANTARLGILLLIAGSFSAFSAPQSRVISGTVVSRLTAEPLAGARVELRVRSGDGGRTPVVPTVFRSVTSNVDGTFRFSEVPPGDYQLVLRRQGYLDTLHILGMSSSNAGPLPLTLLQIEAGRNIPPIRAGMTPEGAITGRLSDRGGRPFVGVVTAVTPVSVSGQSVLATYKTERTNDQGEYRISGLPPGPYFIDAGPISSQTNSTHAIQLQQFVGSDGTIYDGLTHQLLSRECTAPGQIGVSTYYPGTTDPNAAAAVALGAGETRGNVDFSLPSPRYRNVRGRAIPETGLSSISLNVELFPLSPFPGTGSFRCPVGSAGDFLFQNVPEGDYLLTVFGGTPLPSGAGFELRVSPIASQMVKVADSDVDLVVRVVSTRLPAIRTMVLADSGLSPVIRQPVVTLRPYPQFISPSLYGLVVASGLGDGLKAVPGTYQLDLRTIAQGCCVPDRLAYAKSVKFNTSDAANGVIRVVAGGPSVLEIGVEAPVQLHGRLVNRQGVSLENRIVTIVPDPPYRNRLDLYRSARTGHMGVFDMRVAPGSFKIFSIEGVADSAWEIPAVIQAYETQGQPVRIVGQSPPNLQMIVDR